jgi:hypothetical protein
MIGTLTSAFSRRFYRGDRRAIPHPQAFHRVDFVAPRRQRSGARHSCLDGHEEQDGADHRNLRRKLDCTSFHYFPWASSLIGTLLQQIAAFVIPLLVIVGWITGHDLTLFFANFETIVLFVSVLLVNLLIQDGKSNYMEGLMLITLYCVVALSCEFRVIHLFRVPRADWHPVWVS